MTKLNSLQVDFKLSSQINEDHSSCEAKIFESSNSKDTWFIKDTINDKVKGKAQSLLGNKVLKHYLEDLVSEDMLVMNEQTNELMMASKKIDDFKTLSLLGTECQNKKIDGLEKLFAVGSLIELAVDEPNNLGVVIKDDACIATKIDTDNAFQMALIKKSNLNFNFAREFNDLKSMFSIREYQYKVVSDNQVDSLNGKIGILYNQNNPEEFSFVNIDNGQSTLLSEDLPAFLKNIILDQLKDQKDLVDVNFYTLEHIYCRDLIQDEYLKINQKEEYSLDNVKLLEILDKIANTPSEVLSAMVHETLEEVELYFNAKEKASYKIGTKFDAKKEFLKEFSSYNIKTYEELEKGYLEYILQRQDLIKNYRDSVKKEVLTNVEKTSDIQECITGLTNQFSDTKNKFHYTEQFEARVNVFIKNACELDSQNPSLDFNPDGVSDILTNAAQIRAVEIGVHPFSAMHLQETGLSPYGPSLAEYELMSPMSGELYIH